MFQIRWNVKLSMWGVLSNRGECMALFVDPDDAARFVKSKGWRLA